MCGRNASLSTGASRAVRPEVSAWHYPTSSILPMGDPRRQIWCPVAASAIPSQHLSLTSFCGSCPLHLVFIARGLPPVARHVESTVSPPPPQRIALLSPARRCSFCCPGALGAQLLCHHKSDLFRSPESGFKVCSAIDRCRGVTDPMLDGLDSSRHNVSGLSIRQEATVRCSNTRINFTTNTTAADVTTVKVPEMAESITEGTLKQWSKREVIRRKGTKHILTACRGRRLR